MTLRGFICFNLVEDIDHEDADGNLSAHQDDVHELSDGTKCHTDDAERIQAEIDEEDADDEDNAENEEAEAFKKDYQLTQPEPQTPDYVPNGATIISNGTTYIKGQQNENN
jgi:hypothetical protein